jgi:hypothetical protein
MRTVVMNHVTLDGVVQGPRPSHWNSVPDNPFTGP